MAKTPKQRNTEQFATFYGMAVRLAKVNEADAILVWFPADTEIESLKTRDDELTSLIGSDDPQILEQAAEAGLDVVNGRVDFRTNL